ncbi:MAG: PEP-CTERM sorting domain-containing protein [Paucibacter sp.]|nr:PEP-CTERM sorting domain-containing protein [Roseateles sp.]
MASLTVTGIGSQLLLTGDADRGALHIAEGGGSGELSVLSGAALISSARSVQVGLNGGNGHFIISGPGTSASFADSTWVTVGNAGNGVMRIDGGATLTAGQLGIATRQGSANVTLDGVGSRINLGAVDTHRLSVGGWGQGSLIISGGAVLDASVNAAACANRWCGSFVGQAAGSEGEFTVTGTGSRASFVGDFNIGHVNLARPPLDTWTDGTPGGTTRATVQVLDGAVLDTQRVHVGGWLSPSGNGNEQSFSTMLVRGAGSVWNVSGSELEAGEARIGDATHANAHSQWTIDQGGLLSISAPAGRTAGLALGSGGRSEMTVDGSGSRLIIAGERVGLGVGAFGQTAGYGALTLSNGAVLQLQSTQRGWINVGEHFSSGSLRVLSGSRVEGVQALVLGDGLGSGALHIDGMGSFMGVVQQDFGHFSGVQVGRDAGSSGQLIVSGGGLLQARVLEVGRHVGSVGKVVVTGPASTLELSASNHHRLYIGAGELTVAAGALLDGRVDAAACANNVWCGNLIGAHAGSSASFTVTGAGSRASFVGDFQVARAWVASRALDGYDEGVAGGAVVATLNVLDGGLLQTERAIIGIGPNSAAANGQESAHANIAIRGPGSVWQITGGDSLAVLETVGWNAVNTSVNFNITDGGKLLLSAPAELGAALYLSSRPGMTDFKVSGAGSAVEVSSPDSAYLRLGSNGGTAHMSFDAGAQLSGVNWLEVGSYGGQARLSFDGVGTAGHLGSSAYLGLGRRDGQGVLNISNGATLSTDANSQWAFMQIGYGRLASATNPASSGDGTVNISGAGSLLSLCTPAGVAGVPDEYISNPYVSIGDRANGNLRISAGGAMLMQGDAASTAALPRNTAISVGGIAGSGQLSVTGAGSMLKVLGQDAVIWVGSRAAGTGQMQVLDGARVDTSLLHIGNQGGSGMLQLDAAEIHLNGQWSSENLGAGLVLGQGFGSVGTASLGHGAKLVIANGGAAGAGLSLGGTASMPGGSGVLNVSGGSQITVTAAPGLASANIGHSGVGLAKFDGGSSLDLGSGALYIGRELGAVGMLTLAGGASVKAGYVGVGSTLGANTGVGTLIVNDSSLGAALIEISSHGYVGGNGTLAGHVINRGVFNPGNSPGTLTLGGDFTNQAGGRLVLEVAANGAGGFDVDHLIFADAAAIDLSDLQIKFSFLGATDPNAFQASGGFQIASFLQRSGGAGLDDALFSTVSFSASSDAYNFQSFTFSAADGAVFVAQAVPEPASWGLLLLGIGLLLGLRVQAAERGHLCG